MWKFLSLSVILILLMTSCESYDYTVLDGKHELRRFGTKTVNESSFSGGYFLIGGSISGESYSKTMATFTWKMNDEYVISEIEVGKIRVKIDNDVTTPYVEFGKIKYTYDPNGHDLNTLEGMVNNVSHMTITCSEEDYPININFDNI